MILRRLIIFVSYKNFRAELISFLAPINVMVNSVDY